MDIESILTRLTKVRKGGNNRWSAKCPAHNDKSPSLMVSSRPDGSIGLHCFAGCDTASVVQAIGLTMSDLFADNRKEPGYVRPYRPELNAMDALNGLASEAAVIAILAADIADGKPVSSADADRGMKALGRINTALEFVAHGQ